MNEGPPVLPSPDVPRGTFLPCRLDEPGGNAASPAVDDRWADHHCSDTPPGTSANPILHSLAPRNLCRRAGWAGLVDHGASGIPVRPDATGVDERLVAAGERLENRVNGGP